jgi:hypothetical protein
MTPVTFNSSSIQQTYAPASAQNPASLSGSSLQAPGQPADSLHLSPAALRETALTGRVAADAETGSLTSGQAQQLYGQVSSIHSQITGDLQADGGTLSTTDAQAIQQSQNQLSQTIYSDAHDGAAAPSDPNVTRAGGRDVVEAGRIVLNEKAGNLSGAQAQQFGSQLSGIHQQIATDEQANGGTLSSTEAQAINQLQNQLSAQLTADR